MKSGKNSIQRHKALFKTKGYFYGKSYITDDEEFSIDGAYEQLIAYRKESTNTPIKMLVSIYYDRIKLKKRQKSGASTLFDTYALSAVEKSYSFDIDPRILIMGVHTNGLIFYATFAFHSADDIDIICDIIEDFQLGIMDKPDYILSTMANKKNENGREYASGSSLERIQRLIALPSSKEIESKRLRKRERVSVSDAFTETDPFDSFVDDTLRLNNEVDSSIRKVHSGSDYATDTDESTYNLNTTSSYNENVINSKSSTFSPMEKLDLNEEANPIEEQSLQNKPEAVTAPILVETCIHIDSGCVYRNKNKHCKVGGGFVTAYPSIQNFGSFNMNQQDSSNGLDLGIRLPSFNDKRARNNPNLEAMLFTAGENWTEELMYVHNDREAGAHSCSEGSMYMYVARPVNS